MAGSLPSRTSAVCTTTTNVAPPDPGLALRSKVLYWMSSAPRSVAWPLDALSADQLVAAEESYSHSSRQNRHANCGVCEAGWVFGSVRLVFELSPRDGGRTRIRQTALFDPAGLLGYL